MDHAQNQLALHSSKKFRLKTLSEHALPFAAHYSGLRFFLGGSLYLGLIGALPEEYHPDEWYDVTAELECYRIQPQCIQRKIRHKAHRSNIIDMASSLDDNGVVVLFSFRANAEPNTRIGSLEAHISRRVRHEQLAREFSISDILHIRPGHYGISGVVTPDWLIILAVNEDEVEFKLVNWRHEKVITNFSETRTGGFYLPPTISALTVDTFAYSYSDDEGINFASAKRDSTAYGVKLLNTLLLPTFAKGAILAQLHLRCQPSANQARSDIFSIFFKLHCADDIGRWYLVTIHMNRLLDIISDFGPRDERRCISWEEWGAKSASFELMENSEKWSGESQPFACYGSKQVFLVPRGKESDPDCLVFKKYNKPKKLSDPRVYTNYDCFEGDVLSRLDCSTRYMVPWTKKEDWTSPISLWFHRKGNRIIVNRDVLEENRIEIGEIGIHE